MRRPAPAGDIDLASPHRLAILPAMATIVALLVAGVVLLALETVLPGLVAGFVGLLCLAAGVVLAYHDFGFSRGNLVLILVATTLVAGFFLWLRFFPRSRLGRRFVSDRRIGGLGNEQPELIGRTGTALSNLRPSGTALVDGRRVDVVTEGSMVARGSPVRVVAVEGLRVVVRGTGPSGTQPPSS
jgi:membrane-bound serine protease (ClpP class)